MSKDTEQFLQILKSAKGGDDRAFDKILIELEPELKKIAKRYFISGSDPQDVLQESRIGVWKAVIDFDETKDMSFKNFALNLCVKRHVITAVAAANRKKFDLHNNATSLDTAVWTSEDDSEQSLADFIADTEMPLIDRLVQNEEYEENSNKVTKRLTPLEKAIFTEYSLEESYRDIATSLGIKPKAVDNALMRIRNKSREIYGQYIDNYEKDCKNNP
jgi:RNA polymerase sporulation-specific sigma factor